MEFSKMVRNYLKISENDTEAGQILCSVVNTSVVIPVPHKFGIYPILPPNCCRCLYVFAANSQQ